MTKCYNCGRFGHRQTNCPNSTGSIKCYNCGNVGHKQADCPKTNSVKCYSCGNVGHKQADCPKTKLANSVITPVTTNPSVTTNNSTTTVSSIMPNYPNGFPDNRNCWDPTTWRSSNPCGYPPNKNCWLPTTWKSDSDMTGENVSDTSNENIKNKHTDFYFLLDVSGSMLGNKLDTAKQCAMDIVMKMNLLDRMAIVTFDTGAYFKLKPRPVEEILRKNELTPILQRIFAQGGTAIYDAIHLSVSQLHDKNQRTVLLVLTDGDDNSSKHSYADVMELLKAYPNIVLNIVHIGDNSMPNINYQNLCVQYKGEYRVILEHEIKITVEHIFNTYY
jgi:Mg-chelatase subunit ChlD